MLALLLVGSSSAWSTLPQYVFTATTGTQIDMTGSTQILAPNVDDGASAVYNIGFSFNFDGTVYTQFSANTNGLLKLGSTAVTTAYLNYNFPSSYPANFPFIIPFGDDLKTQDVGNGVRYKLTGTSPNQVLTVEWDVQRLSVTGRFFMQVRLYEGSNKFEMWYGSTPAPSASYTGFIGAGVDASSNYVSIRPGPPAQIGQLGNMDVALPESGTLYLFEPCRVSFTGNVAQGFPALISNRDTIFNTVSVQRGSAPVARQPFTVNKTGSICSSAPITFTLSGPAAAEYSITPASTSTYPMSPTITFNPQGVGRRNATLTVSDGSSTTVIYLAGIGSPRITFTGDIPQGGTAAMANKDILFQGIVVERNTTATFKPFTLTNVSTNQAGPAALITYTIKGSSGQYSIAPTSASLTSGQTSTPTITFRPTGLGAIIDTLVVDAEGDVRTFILMAFSGAPAATFVTGEGVKIGSNSVLFTNQASCLGQGVTIPIDITNIGGVPFTITSFDVYKLDSISVASQFPVLRDGSNNPIRSTNYILTEQEGATVQNYPIVVPKDQIKRVYLTYTGSRAAKDFVRIVIHTTGENFTGTDINGTQTLGVLSLNAYGRGVSSRLAGDLSGALPKPIIFPITKVGETVTLPLRIANTGSCTLRVSMNDLAITSGDVRDFAIVSKPTADLMVAPGMIDSSISITFTPRRAGTQRATLQVRTNDSIVQVPGISLAGVYSIDLVGSSPAMLAVTNIDINDQLDFGNALIDGGEIEWKHNVISLENTSDVAARIDSILIEGANAADFKADGTNGLPATPHTVAVGERLDLKLLFAPVGGVSGNRTATLRLVLNSGEVLIVKLTGFAGTRVLTVTPMALSFPTISFTRQSRRPVTITNNGTIPMTITGMVLSDAINFSVSPLDRTVLEPGASEMVEVTYNPTLPGRVEGTLTITSNAPASGGIAIVVLNGDASKAGYIGDGSGVSTEAGPGRSGGEHRGVTDDLSLSGVDGEVVANGVALAQSAPNPARESAEIRYRLGGRGDVTLALYDGTGRLVRILDQGVREQGEQIVNVNVSSLPNGTYHYRLIANGQTLAKTMTVVR